MAGLPHATPLIDEDFDDDYGFLDYAAEKIGRGEFLGSGDGAASVGMVGSVSECDSWRSAAIAREALSKAGAAAKRSTELRKRQTVEREARRKADLMRRASKAFSDPVFLLDEYDAVYERRAVPKPLVGNREAD